MEPTYRVKVGDETIVIVDLDVQEMRQVKVWTGGEIRSRQDLWAGVQEEDPDALIACYCLAKARKGETVRFSAAGFKLNTLGVSLVDGDSDREIEPILRRNDAGEPILGDDGRPVPELDANGDQKWRYTDTGEDVPPTTPTTT